MAQILQSTCFFCCSNLALVSASSSSKRSFWSSFSLAYNSSRIASSTEESEWTGLNWGLLSSFSFGCKQSKCVHVIQVYKDVQVALLSRSSQNETCSPWSRKRNHFYHWKTQGIKRLRSVTMDPPSSTVQEGDLISFIVGKTKLRTLSQTEHNEWKTQGFIL